jgi:serine/threonine protein kinase/nucleoside phosphorylase
MARQLHRDDYTVVWVCALPVELAAARKMLDEEHDTPPSDTHDTYNYICGRVSEHNVVIACLRAGEKGANSAAAVAVTTVMAFPSTRFGLMVGTGGGVPSKEADIRLGDVVVSKPHNTYGGVVQWDSGKATPSGFERTGWLNAPPNVLLNAVAKVRAKHMRGRGRLAEYLSKLDSLPDFTREAAGPDALFYAAYDHKKGAATCKECDTSYLADREPRGQEFVVHYGTIASGKQMMRSGAERDRVSAELGGVLCFEMEAAGLMNMFPCLVICGICDYADSHKNKRWQPYAAATAAAYAKEVLSVIRPAEAAKTHTVNGMLVAKDKPILLSGPAETLAEACGWQLGRTKFLWDSEAGTPLEETERRLLGRGAVGEVHEVKAPGSSKTMARKRIYLPRIRKQAVRDRARIKTELEILRSLDHAHIVKILGCFEEATGRSTFAFCALMYPAADEDLALFLYEKCQDISEEQKAWIRSWYACLASALAYMHSQRIHHEDIKPKNIVHYGSRIYFTDFSSSRRLEAGQDTSTDSPAMATWLFAAPEAMSENGMMLRHGSKTDIFSLGLVFMEMTAVSMGVDMEEMRDALFGESRQNMRYYRVVNEFATFLTNSVSPRSVLALWEQCLKDMLKPDRHARPSAEDVLGVLISGPLFGSDNLCPCCEPKRHAMLNGQATAFPPPIQQHSNNIVSPGSMKPASQLDQPTTASTSPSQQHTSTLLYSRT